MNKSLIQNSQGYNPIKNWKQIENRQRIMSTETYFTGNLSEAGTLKKSRHLMKRDSNSKCINKNPSQV